MWSRGGSRGFLLRLDRSLEPVEETHVRGQVAAPRRPVAGLPPRDRRRGHAERVRDVSLRKPPCPPYPATDRWLGERGAQTGVSHDFVGILYRHCANTLTAPWTRTGGLNAPISQWGDECLRNPSEDR